jgi:glycine/D-amino acid oxidase-like deaminating enzyme
MPDTHVLVERQAQDEIATYDAIVIGAGISGMFMLYRLRELGMTARVFEAGTNVGGTLVLEPLSWRPLRFRKLDLRLFVFEGTDAGMGLERAFLPPA